MLILWIGKQRECWFCEQIIRDQGEIFLTEQPNVGVEAEQYYHFLNNSYIYVEAVL